MKSMFCFVNDMVYMGVKLQVLIKYHTKEPHVCGVEYFRVIDLMAIAFFYFMFAIKANVLKSLICVIQINRTECKLPDMFIKHKND